MEPDVQPVPDTGAAAPGPPLTIVTLFAGRTALLSRWVRLLFRAARLGLPADTRVVAADNAADPAFTRPLTAAVEHLRAHGVDAHLVDLRHVGTYHPGSDANYFDPGRHRQVLDLYNAILPGLGGDVVLTLEDDVFPPPDGLVAVHRELAGADASVAAVGAAYSFPTNTLLVCASWDDCADAWGTTIRWADLADDPIVVGTVGGGCTAWRNDHLQAVLPLPGWRDLTSGWDGALCAALRRRGATIVLDPAIRADHHVHGGW